MTGPQCDEPEDRSNTGAHDSESGDVLRFRRRLWPQGRPSRSRPDPCVGSTSATSAGRPQQHPEAWTHRLSPGSGQRPVSGEHWAGQTSGRPSTTQRRREPTNRRVLLPPLGQTTVGSRGATQRHNLTHLHTEDDECYASATPRAPRLVFPCVGPRGALSTLAAILERARKAPPRTKGNTVSSLRSTTSMSQSVLHTIHRPGCPAAIGMIRWCHTPSSYETHTWVPSMSNTSMSPLGRMSCCVRKQHKTNHTSAWPVPDKDHVENRADVIDTHASNILQQTCPSHKSAPSSC